MPSLQFRPAILRRISVRSKGKVPEVPQQVRFEQAVDKKEFIETHYFPSCPSFQTEYYADGKLIGVGFLDQSSDIYTLIVLSFVAYPIGIAIGMMAAH